MRSVSSEEVEVMAVGLMVWEDVLGRRKNNLMANGKAAILLGNRFQISSVSNQCCSNVSLE